MEIPRHWRLKAERYRLAGSACRRCGQPTFPPRPYCPDCAAPSQPLAVSAIPAPTPWLKAPTYVQIPRLFQPEPGLNPQPERCLVRS